MSLPPEWQIRHAKSRGGRVYFYNKLTKQSRWERPVPEIDDAEYPELIPTGFTGNVTLPNPLDRSSHPNKRRLVDCNKNGVKVSDSKKSKSSVRDNRSDLNEEDKQCARSLHAPGKGKTAKRSSNGSSIAVKQASLSDLNAFLAEDTRVPSKDETICSAPGTPLTQKPPTSHSKTPEPPTSHSKTPEPPTSHSKRPKQPTAHSKATSRNYGILNEGTSVSASLKDIKSFLEESRRKCSAESTVNTPVTVRPQTTTHTSSTAIEKTCSVPSTYTKSSKASPVLHVTPKSSLSKARESPASNTGYLPEISKKTCRRPEKSGEFSTSALRSGNHSVEITDDPAIGSRHNNKGRNLEFGKMYVSKGCKSIKKDRSPTPYSKDCDKLSKKFKIPKVQISNSETNVPQPNSSTVSRSTTSTTQETPDHITIIPTPPCKDVRGIASVSVSSLISGILSSSRSFLTRTFGGGGNQPSTATQSSAATQPSTATQSSENQTQGHVEYSDDDVEMMEIDEVVAEVSLFRNSVQPTLDSNIPAPSLCTSPSPPFSQDLQMTSRSVLNQDVGAVMVDGANAEVRTYLVLDTNVLIHDLSFVTDLIHRGKSENSVVVIPWLVLQELDKLKSSQSVGGPSRKAVNFLLEHRRSGEEGTIFEADSKRRTECPDDRIIECLEWITKSDTDATAILISGDKNLRLKTDVTGFEAYDVTEARDMIANKRDNIQKSLSRRTKGSNSFLAALMMPDKSPEISQHPVLWRGRRTISGNSAPRTPPPQDIDQKLAHFTGEKSPQPTPNNDVARFDKGILQVLDEMAGSMTVFRQQIVSFVETKLSLSGTGAISELCELQKFLSNLVPDVSKLLESSETLCQVPMSQLKQHYSAVSGMVSAIQVYSVHHLHYAPNITAPELYAWLSAEEAHVSHVSATKRHFSDLLGEITDAVNNLMNKKVFI